MEHIKDADAVYQRLWDRGRSLPNDFVLVSVWFEGNVERGYRLMATHDRRLLDEWMANWNDLIEFEVYALITPEEAGEKVAARMRSSTSHRSAGPVLAQRLEINAIESALKNAGALADSQIQEIRLQASKAAEIWSRDGGIDLLGLIRVHSSPNANMLMPLSQEVRLRRNNVLY